MSGRAGTKLRVTARPAHFMPLVNGRAPSIWADGQPITHKPSTRACVERDPSFSSISSETVPPEAGPEANDRATIFREERAVRRKEEDNMISLFLCGVESRFFYYWYLCLDYYFQMKL
jgi:hypothetical protein